LEFQRQQAAKAGLEFQRQASELEFQRQQAQRKQAQAYVQSQAQQESRAVWELEQQLEEWVGQCPVCFISGIEHRHSILNCTEGEAIEVREQWFEMRKTMREKRMFAAYSCCYDCHVPQDICEKWVADGNGKWRRLGSGKCQFEGIIMPLVISWIMKDTDESNDMIRNWLEGSGIEL
jgi:hypothetical protein